MRLRRAGIDRLRAFGNVLYKLAGDRLADADRAHEAVVAAGDQVTRAQLARDRLATAALLATVREARECMALAQAESRRETLLTDDVLRRLIAAARVEAT